MSAPKGTAAIAFLKAKKGVIKKINQLNKELLTDEVISLKITTAEGSESKEPKNWSAREGVLELFWEGQFFDSKTSLPTEKANIIAEQLFTVI